MDNMPQHHLPQVLSQASQQEFGISAQQVIYLDDGEANSFPTVVHEVEQRYDEDLHNRLFLNQSEETQPS